MPLIKSQSPTGLALSFIASLPEVRAAVVQVDLFLRAAHAPRDWVEDMNIILAEVLSNIARHGVHHQMDRIDLDICLQTDELRCVVFDTGRPFNPAQLGQSAPDPSHLREGGYGWFLIRSLARELTYRRLNGANQLTFWVPVSDRHIFPELAD